MIKIILEFESVDAAIVGLGKLVGAPVAPKQPRKGRDDKGQSRGAYKPRITNQQTDPVAMPTSTTGSAVPVSAAQNGELASPIPLQGKTTGNSVSAVTDPEKAVAVVTPKSTVAQAGQGEPGITPGNSAIASAPTFQQVEVAFKKFFAEKGLQPARELFAKFGIARITELKPEQYAEFVNAAR